MAAAEAPKAVAQLARALLTDAHVAEMRTHGYTVLRMADALDKLVAHEVAARGTKDNHSTKAEAEAPYGETSAAANAPDVAAAAVGVDAAADAHQTASAQKDVTDRFIDCSLILVALVIGAQLGYVAFGPQDEPAEPTLERIVVAPFRAVAGAPTRQGLCRA